MTPGTATSVVFMCSRDLEFSPVGKHALFRIGASGKGAPSLSLHPTHVLPGDVGQQFRRLDAAVGTQRHDVGERAATVDPELPGPGFHRRDGNGKIDWSRAH